MNNSSEDPEQAQSELPVSKVATDAAALQRLEHILEALLLSADQPLSLEQLHRQLGTDLGVNKNDLRSALGLLGDRLSAGACEVKEVGSGFRIQVKSDYSEWVGKLWQEKPPRYSRALLETLALICYRQPITRGEIEDVRGVAVSSNILKTLLERGWIRELGVKEVPGRPALFGTTPQFLDDFNLRSLDELPALPEIKDFDQLDVALNRLEASAKALASDGEVSATDSEETEFEGSSADTTDNQAKPADDADAQTVH